MFSSLCAGFAHVLGLDEPPGAVMLSPVDAALTQAWSVATIIRLWRSLQGTARADRLICIPLFAGKCGHPPLLAITHLRETLRRRDELEANGGLRAYLASQLTEGAVERALCAQPPVSRPPASSLALPGDPAYLPCLPVFDGDNAVFLPLPDAGIGSDLDTPDDCGRARRFLAFTHARTRPAPEEAWEWLNGRGLAQEKIGHSLLVGLGALRLGQALLRAGHEVDLAATAGAGLLHDIAPHCPLHDKKCKAHALRAQDLLMDRGWADCALVAGTHTVLPDGILHALGIAMSDAPILCRMRPACDGAKRDSSLFDPGQAIAPALLHACVLVYLADKFFFMDGFVSMERRFAMVLERFAGDAEATWAINTRLAVARAVRQWFTQVSGEEPERFLRDLPDDASPSPGGSPDQEDGAVWESFLCAQWNAYHVCGKRPPGQNGG
jgi:hypothetical protein